MTELLTVSCKCKILQRTDYEKHNHFVFIDVKYMHVHVSKCD